MKKIIVVSKTHLDLGFTDYAENIKKQYINSFIPGAISLARQVNTDKKNFVWTTGSWILKEALKNGDKNSKSALVEAIKNGDIAPHAMPFTTHTELFDEDTVEYGISIVDELDKIRGCKTIAAKMTDVPGHTKGLVKILANHGIKLLHIGVNGASAVPDVPECFLWKCDGAEIVVIYSGAYGGAFKSDLTEEILYFDHTLDNHGAPSPQKVLEKLDAIKAEYPGYEVCAGTLDEYAQIIWQHKDKLPVLEQEIGDTWIHGSATDPYKSAALRSLIELKNQWLADGTMTRDSDEYKGFVDALICVGEHTCGMDTKTYFSDYEHYLKKDFIKARKADKVRTRRLWWDYPQNLFVITGRFDGRRKQGYYSVLEKSWAEQREYIALAVSALDENHRNEAQNALSKLTPIKPKAVAKDSHKNDKNDKNASNTNALDLGKWHLEINSYGGIGLLKRGNKEVIKSNNHPAVSYHSYTHKDYEYWFNHYTRDVKETYKWCFGDFGRPCLKYFYGKYPEGRFEYTIDKIQVAENTATVNLKCPQRLCDELGAPRLVQITYTLSDNGVSINLSWFGKDANRLTEAIYFHLLPSGDSLMLKKLGTLVDPTNVVSKGGRNLHAVDSVQTENCTIKNHHSPLVSVGRGKILEYDNKFEDHKKDGISFVLCNNVWGTNFPLWCEGNASFDFIIN